MSSIQGDMLTPFSEVFFLFILVVATYLKKTIRQTVLIFSRVVF